MDGITNEISSSDLSYPSRLGRLISQDKDPWLEQWNDILDRSRQSQILELGCGSGRDTRYLTERGLNVIAGDYSPLALESCRKQAPLADVRMIDIRAPLPFEDNAFPVVVASLCLHFFPWSETMTIISEIHRCLTVRGFLLARVNSIGDLHYGAAGHPEVEPGLYRMDGKLKRFFDRDSANRLAGPEWKVHSLKEMTVYRYDSPKILWEVVLEKRP